MSLSSDSAVSRSTGASALSLYHLLDPEVLANPYPLFRRLRVEDPVHWDAFLHTWVVTRYVDVQNVLHSFSAERTHTPEKLKAMGLAEMGPIAQLMVKLMLFMDPPAHTRLRSLASQAFSPARVEVLRAHIREIVNRLLDAVQAKGHMDIIGDLRGLSRRLLLRRCSASRSATAISSKHGPPTSRKCWETFSTTPSTLRACCAPCKTCQPISANAFGS